MVSIEQCAVCGGDIEAPDRPPFTCSDACAQEIPAAIRRCRRRIEKLEQRRADWEASAASPGGSLDALSLPALRETITREHRRLAALRADT